MRLRLTLAALAILLAACSTGGPSRGTAPQIDALAASIRATDPAIDPSEAQRAARIAYDYSYQLARQYRITDPPLIHNAKVNAGLRPRGLCYHWAEDMERRLDAEGFATLEMQRAIANSESLFLIEHSTAVITPKGAPMSAGIVLDPWRKGGTLFWSPVGDDKRYAWVPRETVLKRKGQIRYVQRNAGSLAPLPADFDE
tara:strand:+ start:136 stop:732 length:597 start_codon:yes stop_codon:yes gene_type:complete